MGKAQGRVVGLWPGSGLHCMRALKHPRWEDFNYEFADNTKNRLRWLGNGMTVNELTLTGNRKSRAQNISPFVLNPELCSGAWFLDEEYVDVPPRKSLHMLARFRC